MATEITPNLKLVIEDSYTATAKANLRKIDQIASSISTQADGDVTLRSSADIDILPQDASAGGTGIGGTINLGSASQRLTQIVAYGPLGLSDTETAYDLNLVYSSSTATADRQLTIDTNDGDRTLTFEGSLSLLGGFNFTATLTAATAVTFPTTGTLATRAGAETLTNKTFDADANSLSNVRNTNVAADAAISYTKLNLVGSVKNADISTSAAIQGTKIVPTFAAQEISNTLGIKLWNAGQTYYSKLQTSASQAVNVTYTLPTTAGINNYVLTTDGAGGLTWAAPGSGTVTSVSLSAPASVFSIAGSPVTTTGTLALSLNTQAANLVWAGPSAGAAAEPTFRSLVNADFPVSGVTANPYGNATTIPTFTVDDKGLLTAAADVAIAIPSSQVTDFVEAAQDAIGSILLDDSDIDFTYDDATPNITATLTTTGVTGASYGSATAIPTYTVDSKGRLTAAADVAIAIPSTQVTDFVEAVQDAVGTAYVDSASVDFTYDDGANTVTAVVLPAGVNHDLLNGFVANEHVDHSSVDVETAADSGLTGGGDLTATRSLSVDITGTTALGAEPAADDEVLVYDVTGTALRKVTVAQLIGNVGFPADWDLADGVSKAIVHNLNSLDVRVEIYDKTDGATIYVDSVVRTDVNTVTLTSTVAPPAAGWRVLISKVI